jgi:beta-glucosidase
LGVERAHSVRGAYTFPRGFIWGTATAAHQVEGNNTNNDWWAWENQPNRIALGQKSGLACDWWSGRWREDFDRAAAGGQTAHRLSIEWSRIEPTPATWDDSAIEFYRQLLRGARERGLVPMVTLHHFTTPLWMAERGGWASQTIVTHFERFVRKAVAALKDLVDTWVTINEPNLIGYLAYLTGVFPPGKHSLTATFSVFHNTVLAHAAAYHAIHEIQPEARVGIAHHYRGLQPVNANSILDRWIARFRRHIFNDVIANAAHTGRLLLPGASKRIPQAARTQDFIGLNYYSTEQFGFDLRHPARALTVGEYAPGADLSPSGFIANVPEGFWLALEWANRFGRPIIVTENGIEDAEDKVRPRYIALHLHQLWRALNFNWPVEGYYHWSLVDNFEWERGWTQRFGLFELDVETQERRERPSARFYSDICHENALTSVMVERYAPEVLDDLFPTPGDPELSRLVNT